MSHLKIVGEARTERVIEAGGCASDTKIALRLDIDVTVGVNEIVERVREEVLISIIRGDSTFLEKPPAQVVVTALSEYNIGLQLRVWIADKREHIRLRFELRERVLKALTAAGVEMTSEELGASVSPRWLVSTG